MPELSIEEISRTVNGTVLNLDKNIKFTDFHFDTRLIDKSNTLFFALKSEILVSSSPAFIEPEYRQTLLRTIPVVE